MPVRPRPPVDPCVGPTWKIFPIVWGSTAAICSGAPKISARPPRTPATVDTCGSLARRDASAGSIPPVRPAPESITMSPAKLRSMVELTDAVVDEARIVMKPTRPTPIMSADALAAVRLGFRMAFALELAGDAAQARQRGADRTAQRQ